MPIDPQTGEQTDSQGRRITRGAHVAKAQRELDVYDWRQEEKDKRARMHKKLVPEFRPPSKMGAPTKYEDWMPLKVFEWLTDKEVIFTKKLVAAHLGISHKNLLEWMGDTINKQDLGAAVAQGIAIQEAWLASQMADGMKYSASMYAVLKNLHDWKEKTEVDVQMPLAQALEQQKAGARRVSWDRVAPDPLAAQQQHIIDAQIVKPAVPAVLAQPTDGLSIVSPPTQDIQA